MTNLLVCCSHSGLPEVLLKRRAPPRVAGALALGTLDTFEQLPEYVFTVLRYLGPSLSCDTLLMGKLLRLGKAFMEKVSLSSVSG